MLHALKEINHEEGIHFPLFPIKLQVTVHAFSQLSTLIRIITHLLEINLTLSHILYVTKCITKDEGT